MFSKARIGHITPLAVCTFLAIIISVCGFLGCSGGDASFTTPSKLAWDAPSTYADGITHIEQSDIIGYRISVYTDSNLTAKYGEYTVSGPNPPTSINLIDFNNAIFADKISGGPSTTYYLAVTSIVAVNGIEVESAPSNSVSYTFP